MTLSLYFDTLLNEETLYNAALSIIRYKYNFMFYRKKDLNKYETKCAICGACVDYEKKDFILLHKSMTCQSCFNSVVFKRSKLKKCGGFVRNYSNGLIFGYYIQVEFNNMKIVSIDQKHVYLKNVNEQIFYANGIQKNMGQSLILTPEKKDWRKRRHSYYSYCSYEDLMFDITDKIIKSKREYLEGLEIELKSNQKRLLINNIASLSIARTIKCFDLNNYDLFYKYARKTLLINNDLDFNLNKYAYSYLVSNKINIIDYLDYMTQCNRLGINEKYPKNFQESHDILSDKITGIENKKKATVVDKLLIKRLRKLVEYKSGDFVISPIQSFAECLRVGKTLNNCILGYVEDYAKGKKDLYKIVDVKKGNIVGALEIRKNELIQARSKYNQDLPSNQMKIVKEFIKKLRRKNARKKIDSKPHIAA